MAAAASNFTLGQRDLNMCLRRISSNLSATSSAIDLSKGKILAYGFSLQGCSSDNYGNVFRISNHFKHNCVGGNEVQRSRVYDPSIPQLLGVSEEVVTAEDQRQSRGVNGGSSANRWNVAGAVDRPLPEKIMIAVDVDEGT